MDQQLAQLIKELETLKETIEQADIPNKFVDLGWNQVVLEKNDIRRVVYNFIQKLKGFGDNKISEGLEYMINSHISNIQRLNSHLSGHFNNNASHLLYIVPNTLLTLFTIIQDVEYALFSWESINDNKMLPKGLASRVRGVKSALDTIEKEKGDLAIKVKAINDAHAAAESLPADLADLRDAKRELDEIIATAQKDVKEYEKQIGMLTTELEGKRMLVDQIHSKTSDYMNKIESSAEKARKLVDECDDALQITTTQGLAAGFDQKAKQLRESIWGWTAGLLLALGAGIWIGSERIAAFTAALSQDVTTGQAIMHSVTLIFSVAAPLWFAWVSTAQINQRFKLAEDYSYKATVAKSFTGFSKHAERFDSSTEERLFNSTLDRLDEMPLRLVEGKDYNSPWHELMDSPALKRALGVVPELAKDLTRFASKTKLKKEALPKDDSSSTPESKEKTLEKESE